MQKLDFNVEKAASRDARAVEKIESDCFSLPWSYNQIAEEIAAENAVFLVAKADETVLGYVSGRLICDEFFISNIAVDEKFRLCGVASALLDKLKEILSSENCSLITLEVRESNSSARKLYEKFGFTDLGVRKGFYSAPKEDARIYTFYY